MYLAMWSFVSEEFSKEKIWHLLKNLSIATNGGVQGKTTLSGCFIAAVAKYFIGVGHSTTHDRMKGMPSSCARGGSD